MPDLRSSDKRNLLWGGLGALLLLALWQLATCRFPPLVAPPVSQVLLRLAEIAQARDTPGVMGLTVLRLVLGLGIGVGVGALVGLLAGMSRAAEGMAAPFLNVFQSVPPVSWLVLALVWFGFNGRPTIFIVAMASIAPVAINLKNGVRHIDRSFLQMARLYHLSGRKILFDIILPSVRPYFKSALEITLTQSWKLCVMGEVLSTTTGVGGKLVQARQNIEPDVIIAWSVILVVLCWGSQMLMKRLLTRGGGA